MGWSSNVGYRLSSAVAEAQAKAQVALNAYLEQTLRQIYDPNEQAKKKSDEKKDSSRPVSSTPVPGTSCCIQMLDVIPVGNVWLIAISLLIAIKVLLMPCYTSTDFEVHRNWMAITINKPLEKWYFETTSQWTLDYPPFFAYFELILANIADKLGLTAELRIRQKPIFNGSILIFQRMSVVACDFLYMLVCYMFCSRYTEITKRLPTKMRQKICAGLMILLMSNSGLIMVDNIHFQYNSFLTIFVLLSTLFVSNDWFMLGAITYCCLINLKHIYLYYAPAFAIYYLKYYFELKDFSMNNIGLYISKGVMLAVTMLTPFLLSFGPFLIRSGFEGVVQIFSRLFPVSRGLTHAYWAPNFWALYNFMDMIIYKVLVLLKVEGLTPSTFASGLVQEHSHSVLPSITAFISLLFILYSLIPLALLFFQKQRDTFAIYLTISALSFFYFGYHVHEKALLLVSIPLTIVSFTRPKFIPVSLLFSTITSFSLFPLLFTPFEVLIKYGIASTYFILSFLIYRESFGLSIQRYLPTWVMMYGMGLGFIEVYNTFIHKMLFGSALEFFPLMMISVYNAIGVTICYFWILKLALEDEYLLFLKMKKCEIQEVMIKNGVFPVQSVESLEEVQIVAGVDISSSKINSELGVATLVVYSFPDFKLLNSYEQTVFITEPYITDYLALREAKPISEMVKTFVEQYPELRPDVILCDGNGEFHSRGCGVACHIGALTGIPTIGVAKTLNLSLIKKLGGDEKTIKKAEKLVECVSNEKSNGWAAFDVINPVVMNMIRPTTSKVPLFVSVGYGITLDLATQIAMDSAHMKVCEPIRAADLLSRQKIRELFDN